MTSPYSAVADASSGNAHLVRSGSVLNLLVGNTIVMEDDPPHWSAMQEIVPLLPPGRLLVAGLGLGLICWPLLERPDIPAIDIVEIEQDVIDLVTPLLPPDPRRTVIHDNYYRLIRHPAHTYSAIYWDMANGSPWEAAEDHFVARVATGLAMPDVPLYRFGTLKPVRL